MKIELSSRNGSVYLTEEESVALGFAHLWPEGAAQTLAIVLYRVAKAAAAGEAVDITFPTGVVETINVVPEPEPAVLMEAYTEVGYIYVGAEHRGGVVTEIVDCDSHVEVGLDRWVDDGEHGVLVNGFVYRVVAAGPVDHGFCAECAEPFVGYEWEERHSREDGEDIHAYCCTECVPL